MRLSWIGILSAFVVLSCTSLPRPKLDPLDCVARSDCYVVKVDNSHGQFAGRVSINGYSYGEVGSYNIVIFSLYTSQLRNGNCAYVSVKFINAPYNDALQSSEECIVLGEYYQVDITNSQKVIWLTPLRVGSNVTR